MAESIESKDLFKALLKVVKEILAPGLDLMKDPEARTEFLGSLGLSSNGAAPPAQSTTELDKYIAKESEEVDSFALASAFADLVVLLGSLEGFFRAAASSEEDPDFAAGEAMSAFINLFIWDYIRRRNPTLHSSLQLLNVLDSQTAAEGGSYRFVKDTLIGYFKRLGKSFSEFATEDDARNASDGIFLLLGAGLFILDKAVLEKFGIDSVQVSGGYGFEGVTATATPIADALSNRTFSYAVKVTPFDDPDNQVTLYNSLVLVPKNHGGVALVANLSGKLDLEVKIAEHKKLLFDAEGAGNFRIGKAAAADAGKKNKVAITYKQERPKPTMWSMLDKPSVKLGVGTFAVGFKLSPDDFEIKAKVEMPFYFGKKPDQGFPFTMLPEKVEEKIPLAFGYSLKRSFFFGDSSAGAGTPPATGSEQGLARSGPDGGPLQSLLNALDFRIPLHKDIGGVVGFQLLNIKTNVDGNFDTIQVETSLDFWLKFGPVLTLSVSRLGMLLELKKDEHNGPLFGYGLGAKLKMPNGLGVRVNAAVIKGGGFLYIDEAKGEYFGALELDFKDLFTLKAVGLINTRMPDGSNGFSMIVIITADFAPIQLGFGFTLLGVGGLLGLNRSANVEALRVGIRTNAIGSILFPRDVVGNISRIISDIREIFPIKEGQFLVGLMGKFGFGTPTLIKIELGFVIELPDPRILLLGVISTKLPTEETSLLRLQVNFLGVLDFQNRFIYFEARLFDSHLVGFPLTGSMAFAVAWGAQSVFAISVGGFHPDFKDYPSVPTLPGAFRDMVRVGMSLLSGNNPRLTLECYFALTSNTLQLGARLELLASGPMGFNLYGMLAFDALFIFDPFSFNIRLEATLAIRKGTNIIRGIHFAGELSGPTPWHVEGEVTFGLLFFDVTIGFSETWGDPPARIEQATADLMVQLSTEILDGRNWRAVLPDVQHQQVTHRKPEEELPPGTVVLFPFGELRFSQRSLPLGYAIQKYGSFMPKDASLFNITRVIFGTAEEQGTSPEQELFAPGHFTEMSEADRLSRKSFEPMTSGFRLQDSGKLWAPQPHLTPFDVEYELNYTADDKEQGRFRINPEGFRHLSRHTAVSRSALSWSQGKGMGMNKPAPVVVDNKGFAIADSLNLSDVGGGFRAATIAEAKSYLGTLVSANPELAGRAQVVESFELMN